jgi:hypothetical protein
MPSVDDVRAGIRPILDGNQEFPVKLAQSADSVVAL